MIGDPGFDPRQGNMRHQRLVQQIMGKYMSNRQGGGTIREMAPVGGVRGGGAALGTGMLNKFAKRGAGTNVTNPMSMSITAALRNALGPGGAGIPGSNEHSNAPGQDIGITHPGGYAQQGFDPGNPIAGLNGSYNSQAVGNPGAPDAAGRGYANPSPGYDAPAPSPYDPGVAAAGGANSVDPGFAMHPDTPVDLGNGMHFDPTTGQLIPSDQIYNQYGSAVRGIGTFTGR